jgi:hypothetical protein
LDAVSGALEVLPTIRLARLPRMADFAVWGKAACVALGWDADSFTSAYAANRLGAHETILEDSPIAAAVRQLIERSPTWTGTATKLLGELASLVGDKVAATPRWPKSPSALTGALRRLAPTLREIGIDVVFGRKSGGKRDRTITLTTLPEKGGDKPSLASLPSQTQQKTASERDESGTDGTIAVGASSRENPAKDGIRDGWDGRDAKIPILSSGPEPELEEGEL